MYRFIKDLESAAEHQANKIQSNRESDSDTTNLSRKAWEALKNIVTKGKLPAAIGLLAVGSFTTACSGEQDYYEYPRMQVEIDNNDGNPDNDELWGLAKISDASDGVVGDDHLDKLVFVIKDINGLENSVVHNGQILKIPNQSEDK